MSLTWCFPNQTSAQSIAVLHRVALDGAIVPAIWHMEMANVLGLKLRDGNFTAGQLQETLIMLRRLDIVTDTPGPAADIKTHLERVARFRVAAYDSIYLDLALRTGLPLATFDKAMVGAAQRSGIPLVTS